MQSEDHYIKDRHKRENDKKNDFDVGKKRKNDTSSIESKQRCLMGQYSSNMLTTVAQKVSGQKTLVSSELSHKRKESCTLVGHV